MIWCNLGICVCLVNSCLTVEQFWYIFFVEYINWVLNMSKLVRFKKNYKLVDLNHSSLSVNINNNVIIEYVKLSLLQSGVLFIYWLRKTKSQMITTSVISFSVSITALCCTASSFNTGWVKLIGVIQKRLNIC